ncbi:hypothetical protein Dimus_003405 [Dionaea muscipula]
MVSQNSSGTSSVRGISRNSEHQKVFLSREALACPLCKEPLTIPVVQSPSLQENLCWLSPAAQIKGKMEHHIEECPSSSPPRPRNNKGITLRDGSMPKGAKKTVSFNARDQPIGPNVAKLMGDLRAQVLQNVDINIDSWWHVPKEAKEVIRGLLENANVIGVDHKKKLLHWGQ